MKNKHQKMKKSLGQNFLRDASVIEHIIDISDLSSSDTVFEIGPGDGALTETLLATGARVVALEIDADLLENLQGRFADAQNFTLLHQDIRRFHLPQYLAQNDISSYKVVANLPYYITSSIIRYFLESESPPTDMTLMVQKEVAQRICADPGALSILGISVQYFGEPEIALHVPAEAFEPVPKVDSAVIVVRNIKTYGGTDRVFTKKFFRIVKAGFCAKRKMLTGNLSNSLSIPKDEILDLLERVKVVPTARAQELTLEQWLALTQIVEIPHREDPTA